MPAPFKAPLVNHSTYTLVLSMWSFKRDRNKEEGETRDSRGGTKIQMERKTNQ